MTYLIYDPKGHGDLYGRFDLVYEPKVTVILDIILT